MKGSALCSIIKTKKELGEGGGEGIVYSFDRSVSV